MLIAVEVRDETRALVARLPVAEYDGSKPYLVKDADGLDPVKANVSTTGYANQDGGFYQSAKTEMRNIVLTLGYRPDITSGKSIQTIRREMYGIFDPKALVNLRFIDSDEAPVEIDGYVESHETSIFSRDPEVQISILCPDPYFRAIKPVVLSAMNNNPIYTSYFGTAETGFLFELLVNRNFSGTLLRAYISDDNYYDIHYGGALVSGDVLSISTERGNKFVRRTRGGETVSVLNGITRGELSMTISPRTDSIYTFIGDPKTIPYRVTYTPKFIGI